MVTTSCSNMVLVVLKTDGSFGGNACSTLGAHGCCENEDILGVEGANSRMRTYLVQTAATRMMTSARVQDED